MPQDFAGVMHEFKHGDLHSGGSGKVVTSRKQAEAIAESEQHQLGQILPKDRLAKVPKLSKAALQARGLRQKE
jgi:hypothetical protein